MSDNEDNLYDCGCINHGDDEAVQCESCGYLSCLDCHHVNSQSANVDDWQCYEGYGCKEGIDPERTHILGGVVYHGTHTTGVCSDECWCKEGEEE